MRHRLLELTKRATSKRPPRRYVLAASTVLAAILVGVAAAPLAMNRFSGQDAGAPALHIDGHFALMTSDGRAVTDQTFRGKWLIIYFGYTFCPDLCPTALSDISVALEKLGPMAEKVQPLFITVDPERDTPAVIKDYLSSFDPHLLGLTGDPAAIAAVAKAYRVYFKKVPLEQGGYTMDHTAIVYLMDKTGRFVSPFSLKPTTDAAAADLRRYL